MLDGEIKKSRGPPDSGQLASLSTKSHAPTDTSKKGDVPSGLHSQSHVPSHLNAKSHALFHISHMMVGISFKSHALYINTVSWLHLDDVWCFLCLWTSTDESIALLLPRCPPCRAGPQGKDTKSLVRRCDFDSSFLEVLAPRANLTLNA